MLITFTASSVELLPWSIILTEIWRSHEWGKFNQILMMLFPGNGNCYVTDGNHESSYFGFAEAENCLPFNQGVFYDDESVPSMSMQYVFQSDLSAVDLAIVNSGVLPKPVGVSVSIVIA